MFIKNISDRIWQDMIGDTVYELSPGETKEVSAFEADFLVGLSEESQKYIKIRREFVGGVGQVVVIDSLDIDTTNDNKVEDIDPPQKVEDIDPPQEVSTETETKKTPTKTSRKDGIEG